jgi:hypothetical protein
VIPLLSKYTVILLGQRFNFLKKRYLKSHCEPPKFRTLLKGLLKEAKHMDDKLRKRQMWRSVQQTTASEKGKGDSSKFKSAEFVSTSDEEDDEEA